MKYHILRRPGKSEHAICNEMDQIVSTHENAEEAEKELALLESEEGRADGKGRVHGSFEAQEDPKGDQP